MSKALDFRPQSQAQERAIKLLLDDVTRSVGFGGGAGGGKSFVGAAWVWMMCNTYPGVRYFFGRKELKRLKQTTQVSYNEFCDLYKIPKFQQGKFNEQSSTIFFNNGSEIVFLDLAFKPSDPLGGSFGSLLFTGGFIDESYEIAYPYIEVLYTRIGRWKNEEYGILPKIMEGFNPDKGHCYTRFYQPYRDNEETEDTKFVPALAIDRLKRPKYFRKFHKTHSSDKGTGAGIYVDNLIRLKSRQIKERLLWGNFDYDDDPLALLTFEQIRAFILGTHITPDKSKRYLTADIAMMGSDRFILLVWYGWAIVDFVAINKSGGADILKAIRTLQLKHQIPDTNITYDADGVGAFLGGEGGFIEYAIPFNNGASPKKIENSIENYANLKTQCAYHMAKMIADGLMGITMELPVKEGQWLEEELGQLKRADLDMEGKLRLKSKKDVRRDIGRSPDISDAILMRMIFEISGRGSLGFFD